jgi:hypothetical protein
VDESARNRDEVQEVHLKTPVLDEKLPFLASMTHHRGGVYATVPMVQGPLKGTPRAEHGPSAARTRTSVGQRLCGIVRAHTAVDGDTGARHP